MTPVCHGTDGPAGPLHPPTPSRQTRPRLPRCSTPRHATHRCSTAIAALALCPGLRLPKPAARSGRRTLLSRGPPTHLCRRTMLAQRAVPAACGPDNGLSAEPLGNWPSLAPMYPRCRACMAPQEGRVLLPTPLSSGGMPAMLSRTWLRPQLRGVGPLSRVDARLVYSINHRNRRVMSPRSTDATLSHRFTRPLCECSRAGRTYQTALRSNSGVS